MPYILAGGVEDILILFRGETFNSQFASSFVSFDAEVKTYTMRILFFLLFPRIVKNYVFKET